MWPFRGYWYPNIVYTGNRNGTDPQIFFNALDIVRKRHADVLYTFGEQ